MHFVTVNNFDECRSKDCAPENYRTLTFRKNIVKIVFLIFQNCKNGGITDCTYKSFKIQILKNNQYCVYCSNLPATIFGIIMGLGLLDSLKEPLPGNLVFQVTLYTSLQLHGRTTELP